MTIFQLDSVNGYEPRPDFHLRIQDDGTVFYEGHYFVGVVGRKAKSIDKRALNEVLVLSEFLIKRNQKNYLKKNIDPVFKIKMRIHSKWDLEIDKNDVVSADVIAQILDLTGAREWIHADLDLYLVMSNPDLRSKEMMLLRASDKSQAVSFCLNDKTNRRYKSEIDYLAIRVGLQKPDSIVNPVIYFSYSDFNIHKRAPTLLLNQGPVLEKGSQSVFLFISFGKRYNDASAAYILVLGKNKENAAQVFKKFYPHFMPDDFQQVDLKVDFVPNPLFETHIPIAIR